MPKGTPFVYEENPDQINSNQEDQLLNAEAINNRKAKQRLKQHQRMVYL